jgi:GNAT superfamily N-acetyltransferase
MKIIDLDEEHLQLYFMCLEDWSSEVKEAGNLKEIWYRRKKDNGLRVKLALDDHGTAGGMIQYMPIEHAFVRGTGLYFITCIWVHGHKQGRGSFQRMGMGTALLSAAEEDARTLGAKGIAAWGVILPFWMRASWFRKHGYVVADREGIMSLLWKPFRNDAHPPLWVHRKGEIQLEPGKVTVSAFCNGWCTAQNMAFERTKRACSEPGLADKVVFRAIDTFERKEVQRCGYADAIFINKKQVRTGPPPSYDKIRSLITREVKRLK